MIVDSSSRDKRKAAIIWLESASARADSLLTPRRVRRYPILIIFLSLAVLIISVSVSAAKGNLPFDSFGNPVAVDLTAHISAGRIALRGDISRLYDLAHQLEIQKEFLGGAREVFLDAYLSPPFVAYLYAPLAALPYLLSAGLWTIFTLVLLLLSFHLIWPLIPNLHRYGYGLVLMVVFSAWPVFELLGDGQDSAISLLLLIAGLRLLLARRDLYGGAVLGLGVFKPQLFLLFPVLLILQRRWTALAGWIAVASALTAVSVGIMGIEGIHSYVTLLTSNSYTVWIAERLGWKMQSLTALARTLLPGPAALLVRPIVGGAGIIALAMIIRTARERLQGDRSFLLLYAFAVLLNPLVNPHLFLYDVVIFLLPALVLLSEAPANRAIRLSLAGIYILTLTSPIRYVLFGGAPWPLPVLAAPWTVLPLVVLLIVCRRLLSPSLGWSNKSNPSFDSV